MAGGNGKGNGKYSAKQKRGLAPPWKKGQSGNPKGRPKGTGNFTNVVQAFVNEHLVGKPDGEQITLLEAMARTLAMKAAKGDVAAARLILDRIDPVDRSTHLHINNNLSSVVTPSDGFTFLDAIELDADAEPNRMVGGNGAGNGEV